MPSKRKKKNKRAITTPQPTFHEPVFNFHESPFSDDVQKIMHNQFQYQYMEMLCGMGSLRFH